MKVFLVTFSFITLSIELHIIVIPSIKQKLGHAWLLGSYTLCKLLSPNIFLSIKQNLSYAWFLGPYVLGKLILHAIFLSVKQNLNYA